MHKHSMKLFLASSAFAVAVASVSIPIQAEAATKTFKDVSSKNAYYNEISEIASKGIIHGYEDGTFKPNELITRKHAAVLLARAFKPEGNPKREFIDVNPKNTYYEDLVHAVANGWLEAPNGKVRPNDTITRGEMAIALTRAAKLNSGADHGLKDVTAKYEHAVSILAKSNITTGYEDKTFRENQGLSRAHYAVFMYRSMNYKDEVKENDKGTLLYGNSYIGKYGPSKVPTPVGVTYEIQSSEYNDLKALIPKGGYGEKLPINDAKGYESILNKYQSITGSTKEELSNKINETARVGRTVYFVGGNGMKYFVIFQFKGGLVMLGEDHR